MADYAVKKIDDMEAIYGGASSAPGRSWASILRTAGARLPAQRRFLPGARSLGGRPGGGLRGPASGPARSRSTASGTRWRSNRLNRTKYRAQHRLRAIYYLSQFVLRLVNPRDVIPGDAVSRE